MGKCVFNRKWLSDEKFSWVKEFKGDKHKAMCCVCNKVIVIERVEESALKSRMKGEKHKRNTGASPSSTLVMSTFLRKEVSSSCDQRSESSSNRAEANNDKFSVPPPPPVNQQSSVLREVKDVAWWGTLWQKMTCSLLKFCGHSKRYQLTFLTSQTRKLGKFFKLCFRVVQ